MNNIIEFKKDCIMKTFVAEITNISLTHDYKILDDTIEGYFDLVGEYKVTKSSITTEEFSYTIPFTIALSSMIDKDTIDITISDFSYSVEKDILHLKMALSMDYEELTIDEHTSEFVDEELNKGEEVNSINEMLENINEEKEPIKEEYHNELMFDDKLDKEETINKVLDVMPESGYNKFKVYIMREEDTLESIMIKYNVKINDIKEYNDVENIKIGDKIVIPCLENEKN